MTLTTTKTLLISALTAIVLCCAQAHAQYAAIPKAAFLWSGTAWTPASSSFTGDPLTYGPPQLPAIALYCFNSGTGQWVPATSACLGGGSGASTSSPNTWTAVQTFSLAGIFGGSANTFANNAVGTENDVIVSGGTTGTQANAALEFALPAGTAEWKWKMDTSDAMHLSDVVNSLDREIVFQNGNTDINAGAGSNAVCINCSTGSGTGGVLIQNGGASPSTKITLGSNGLATLSGVVATAAAPTVSASQIGYGGTTAASSNCGSAGAACIVVNVAGTIHYVPYY